MSTLIEHPYDNEEESVSLSGITIENRMDRISLYGSLDLTRDKDGLKLARALKALLTLVVEKLESEELPEKIMLAARDETVDNPFL